MPFHITSEYLNLPAPHISYIIDKILPVGGLMVEYGAPKLGKTWSALQMAMAIANPDREDWMGYKVNTHGHVAFLELESPLAEWRGEFIRRLQFHHECHPNIYWVDKSESDMPYPFNILRDGGAWLSHCINLMNPKPKALMIDSWRELYDGDENDSGVMRNVYHALMKVVKDEQIAVVAITHPNKAVGYNTPLMSGTRGSNYIVQIASSVCRVTPHRFQLHGRILPETRLKVERYPEDENSLGYWKLRIPTIEEVAQDVRMRFGKQVSPGEIAKEARALIPELREMSLDAIRKRLERT